MNEALKARGEKMAYQDSSVLLVHKVLQALKVHRVKKDREEVIPSSKSYTLIISAEPRWVGQRTKYGRLPL